MARQYQQSEATAERRRFPVYLVDATDGLTPENGESGGQPQIVKLGATTPSYANTTNTLVFLASGSYYVELTAAEIDTLGEFKVRYKSAATAEFNMDGQVVGYDPFAGALAANVTFWQGFPTTITGGLPNVNVDAWDGGTPGNDPDAALVAIHLDHLLAAVTTSFPGNAGSILGEMLERITTWRYVTEALSQAPSAGGGTDWTVAERNQIRYRLQMDGTTAAPAADTPTRLPVDTQAWDGDTASVKNSATTNLPQVDVTALNDSLQSAADLQDFADAGYDPATNKVEGVKLVDTTTTNTDMRGTDGVDTSAMRGTDNAALPADVDASLAAVNLDHLVGTATGIPAVPSGTFLDQIMRQAAGAFNRETDSLQAIRDTAPLGTAMRGTDGVDTAPMRGTDGASTHSAADVWTAATRTLTSNANLNDPTAADVAAAVRTIAIESQGNYTLQQSLSIILSVLAGVTSDSGATVSTPNGLATRVAATINASQERTAMTLTPSS